MRGSKGKMAGLSLSASSVPLSVMPAKSHGVWQNPQRKGKASRSTEPGDPEAAASRRAWSPSGAADSSNLRARKQWNVEALGSHAPETSQQLRSPGTHSRWKVESDKLHMKSAGDLGQIYSQDASTDLSEKPGTSAAVRTFQDWKKDNLTRIKERAKSLRLKHLDVANAVDLLHAFIRQFFSYLNECPERPYFRDMRELRLGSSHEFGKLLHPNEFDVLLSLPITDYVHYAEVEGYNGLFYTLTLPRKSRSFPAAFLMEDGQTVSPERIMAEFQEHVDQFIKVFYSEIWKISFSHVEKEILKSHTRTQSCRKYHATKCCRPECLQMLERLLGALKTEHPSELAPLRSYHAETSFFHTLMEWKQDADGKPPRVAPCFERVLANFIQQVATAQLPHFFIPKCNLFGTKFFPPSNLKFLLARLREKQKKKQPTTVSRKKVIASPLLNSDMSWPLMITVGLMILVLIGLSHFGS
ncbi:cyclic GMP-AMP synthase-like isoform X2 [Pelodiscus sinensis]|uniref:cyclic GMP-AMP synthase-like isoform X2 n=1 Tax=Pelodiscus sinensis TaxID=13735 RepID=UPI003F6C2010